MRRPKGAPPPLPSGEAVKPWTLTGLTPIVNGGSRSKAVDPDRPVRGPSVRGQLRMAWRLIQPTTDVAQLRRAEAELFGAVFQEDGRGGGQRASRARVAVLSARSKTAPAPSSLGYGLWTLLDAKDDQLHVHVQAKLLLHGLSRDVIEAWMLTGGLGSRTRRGYGLFWLEGVEGFERPASGAAWADRLRALAPPPGKRGWPSLSGAQLLAWGEPVGSAEAALSALLTTFQAARGMTALGAKQFDGEKRLPSVQRDWLALRHGRGTVETWPAFGLPIQVRSANQHLSGTGKRVIKPAGKGWDRLPSPILLRVVPVGRGYLPAMIVLRPWAFPEVETGDPGVRGRVRPEALDELADFLKRGGATDLGRCA
jgi:hypothetical protein